MNTRIIFTAALLLAMAASGRLALAQSMRGYGMSAIGGGGGANNPLTTGGMPIGAAMGGPSSAYGGSYGGSGTGAGGGATVDGSYLSGTAALAEGLGQYNYDSARAARQIEDAKHQAIENELFRRLILSQMNDLRALNGQRARFVEQRQQVLFFVNGDGSPQSRAKFRDALYRHEQSPEMVHLLQCSLSSLTATNFTPDAGSLVSIILKQDAQLADPPFLLLGRDSGDPIAVARQRVGQLWNAMVAKLRAGDSLNGEDYRQLSVATTRWGAAAENEIEAGEVRDRLAATTYLKQVDAIFAKLKYPTQAEQLRRHVQGYQFTGGTVADLINFVLDRGISVRYGSPAQLTLRELGSDVLRELDGKIQLVNQRIDTLTTRNPSHAATLRQSLGGQPDQPLKDPANVTAEGANFVNPLLGRLQEASTAGDNSPLRNNGEARGTPSGAARHSPTSPRHTTSRDGLPSVREQ